MNKASNTEKNEASTVGASESGATKKATKGRKVKKTETAAGVPEKQKDTKTVQGNNLDESINKTMELQKRPKTLKELNQEFGLTLGSLIYSDLLASLNVEGFFIPFDLREKTITEVYKPISEWRRFFEDKNFKQQIIRLINNFNYSDCLMFLEFAANRVFINKSNEILKLDMWDTSGYAKVKYNPS